MLLSIFPDLFTYAFGAIALLRITLGIIFIWFAYAKFFRERTERIEFFSRLGLKPAVVYFSLITGLELVVGVMLLVGAYTQIAALVTLVLMILATLIKWRRPLALPKNTIEFYILLAVVSFTLIFLGAGAFALDLPL